MGLDPILTRFTVRCVTSFAWDTIKIYADENVSNRMPSASTADHAMKLKVQPSTSVENLTRLACASLASLRQETLTDQSISQLQKLVKLYFGNFFPNTLLKTVWYKLY